MGTGRTQRETFAAGEAEFVFCDQSIGEAYEPLYNASKEQAGAA